MRQGLDHGIRQWLVLNRLLHAAIIAGKRVRTETRLGGGAISVASAASELAGKIFQDLSRRSVLLIGAGEMGELTARHMLERGVSHLTIANRTFSKALGFSDLGEQFAALAAIVPVLTVLCVLLLRKQEK